MSDWRDAHLPDLHWARAGCRAGSRRCRVGWPGAASESRFAGEVFDFEKALPHGGDGPTTRIDRQVLVVPGFGFGDAATLPMQIALKRAGSASSAPTSWPTSAARTVPWIAWPRSHSVPSPQTTGNA